MATGGQLTVRAAEIKGILPDETPILAERVRAGLEQRNQSQIGQLSMAAEREPRGDRSGKLSCCALAAAVRTAAWRT